MLNTALPPWPSYSKKEAEAIHRVLLSNKVNYWTGQETREFEREFAKYTDSKHAIALANGTLALELALKALGIGPGDEVIVTPRTYIASVSSVVTAGATPVFVDVDENSQNIEARTIAAGITDRTRAVIVVHLAGMPADMGPIMQLAHQHGIKVIEDCAQAHGAKYKGRSVGSIGHIGAWSFCQDKIMTTGGEGGMVTTNDQSLWMKMWSYKDHGKNWDSMHSKQHPSGFRWVHESFGTNWRMSELQGVIGRIQTAVMPEWQQKRLHNAQQIWSACESVSWLRVPTIDSKVTHAAYKAYVFIRPENIAVGCDRNQIVEAFRKEGVPAYQGSCSEVYLEKAFDDTAFRPSHRLPVARQLGDTSLMFLVHPTLEQCHIDKTLDAIKAVDSWMSAISGKCYR